MRIRWSCFFTALLIASVSASCTDVRDQNRERNEAARLGAPSLGLKGTVAFEDLRAGDCFFAGYGAEWSETVTIEDCAGEWEFKVLSLVLLDLPADAEYPGDSYFNEQARRLCPQESDSTIGPTENGWLFGDRVLVCMASRGP
jgi:hypothetical protein